MNCFSLGAKYFVSSLNGLHAVCAGSFASRLFGSIHSKEQPYSFTGKPKCLPYHSLIFFGSLVLKKTPPSPVTRFIFVNLFVVDCSYIVIKYFTRQCKG